MTQDMRAVAELLAGRHYECEDPWYSCPLSEEGCTDETKPKECYCGREKTVAAIAAALADARRAGLEEAVKLCEAEALIDYERGYYCNEMAKAIRAKAAE